MSLLGLPVLPAASAAEAAGSCPADAARWASSSNRLYVSGEVTCTLTELDALTKAPISLVDKANKVWLVGANIVLQNGATLRLHGADAGGDVNELRLRSNNAKAAGSVVEIQALWGTIDIRKTRITSWDEAAVGPDTETASYGRSFIRALSFLDAGGVARESRLDIIDSDIGYLGYQGAESYGVSWKVRGTTPGIFDAVAVRGDVTGSHIHHNHFGLYTFGAQEMRFVDNEIDHNARYGLDPHDDSDFLTIEGNDVHHNGSHGIICSKRCNDLVIRENTVYANTGNGIFLHRQVTNSLVEHNTSNDNTDAGIALFDSHGNTIRHNHLVGNLRGIRLSAGASDNLIEDNLVENSAGDALYFYKGTDKPTEGDGRPRRNQFIGNTIRGTGGYAVRLSDADENLFSGNVFEPSRGLRFERAEGNRVVGSDLRTAGPIVAKGTNTTVEVRDFAQARLQVDKAGAFSLAGEDIIFDPEEDLSTRVTPAGSSMALNFSSTGGVTEVAELDFRVVAGSGGANINPEWKPGDRSRKWRATASAKGQKLTFELGGLTPGGSYALRRNGRSSSTLRADGNGVVRLDETIAGPVPVRYQLTPKG